MVFLRHKMLQVDYATWFGSNTEFIHCIQMLPFVPMSEDLLRKEWIQEEYTILQTVCTVKMATNRTVLFYGLFIILALLLLSYRPLTRQMRLGEDTLLWLMP